MPIGSGAARLAVGDFDEDGRDDVVIYEAAEWLRDHPRPETPSRIVVFTK